MPGKMVEIEANFVVTKFTSCSVKYRRAL